MSETTLRVKTQADIAALKEYRRELQEFTRAVREAGQATRDANGSGGAAPGPGGGTAPSAPGYPAGSGAPMPAPTAPPPMPPPPPAPTAPPSGAPPAPPPTAPPPTAAPPSTRTDPNDPMHALNQRGGAYLSNMGSMAVGIGLGASVFGFLLNSGQKYLELSKIITHVGQRFREAEQNVIGFGGAMGYTIGETAGLVEQLGNVQDQFTRGDFLRSTGFARHMGIDPGQALSTFGRLGALRGHEPLSQRQMAEIAGRALSSGMGQGRFGEYLDLVRTNAEAQFAATGRYDFRSSMAAMNIPGIAFGLGDPRAQGQAGQGMLEGLNATLTGNPAMQTFMMRAMGFGSAGGPGYIEMRKRLEAGIHDPQNIVDLFTAFRQRGMGRGAQYRALESVAGGNLKAWQIEALVDNLGSEAGIKTLQRDMGGDYADSYVQRVVGTGAADFVSSGAGKISLGEKRALQMEGMQMAVGDTVATAMIDMTDTLQNVVKMMQNLLGIDFEAVVRDLSGSLKELSANMERATRPGATFRREVLEAPANALTDEQAREIDHALRYRYAGPGWGLVQGGYYLMDNYSSAGGGGQAP